MRKALSLAAAWALVTPMIVSAQSRNYDSRSYARLAFVSGTVHVQRAGQMGYEAGTVNLALIEGDKIGTQDGRAEASFGASNVLRLDRLSQVEFVNLPRDIAEPFKVHLLSGSLYLRVSRLESDKEFEVHTPDASFYILSEGLFRVDVLQDKTTRFSAVEGEAEVAGEEGSFTLSAGQSLTASNGKVETGLSGLYAENDDFGLWNQSRDGLMARRDAESSYLPEELAEYGSELEENGDWRYEADYGYVWVPRVRYYDDWRPYYYGRWLWYPVIGWTWVADEPWGWCVTHYGRWHWGLDLGWYWIPTRHWGPAWVHWYHGDRHYGWCALNWWNRPTVVINNHFYYDYSYNDYSVHNRALVVVNRNELQSPRISAVALRGEALRGIDRVTLAARQPGFSGVLGRSGRLQGEAARTFDPSRGRRVERSFGRGDSVRGVGLRSREGQGLFRSTRETGVVRGRSADSPDLAGRRAIRRESSSPSRSGIREFGLTRRTERTTLEGARRSSSERRARSASSLDSRRIRTFEPSRSRTANTARIATRTAERSAGLRREYTRSPSRAATSRRSSSSTSSLNRRMNSRRESDMNLRPVRPRTFSSRNSASRPTYRSSSVLTPGRSSGRRSSGTWSSPSSSSSASRRRSATRFDSSPSRSSSRPSYSRPSYGSSGSRSRSSANRTFTAPSRSPSRSGSFRSSGGSRPRSSSGITSRGGSSSSLRSSRSSSRSSSSQAGRSSSSSSSNRSRGSRRR